MDVDEPQTADLCGVCLAVTKQRAVGCGILQQMFSEQIIPISRISGDQSRVSLFRKGAFPNYGAASGFDSCGIGSAGRIELQEFFGIAARKRRINAVITADGFGRPLDQYPRQRCLIVNVFLRSRDLAAAYDADSRIAGRPCIRRHDDARICFVDARCPTVVLDLPGYERVDLGMNIRKFRTRAPC